MAYAPADASEDGCNCLVEVFSLCHVTEATESSGLEIKPFEDPDCFKGLKQFLPFHTDAE